MTLLYADHLDQAGSFARHRPPRQRLILLAFLAAGIAPCAFSQGPMPEEGATLFPSGAFISYSSIFTTGRFEPGTDSDTPGARTRPTFQHEVPLTFSMALRRDVQFTAVVPIVTKRVKLPDTEFGGTGLGDALVSLKHRFLRRDSERGTTQAAVTVGPKLPTGATGQRDSQGSLLPIQLQPGSGSTDFFVKVNGTYTGLFNLRRLVADGSVSYFFRTEGSRDTRLGNAMEARLWLPYRPYQAKTLGAEWFLGPSLTWQHRDRDRQSGVRQLFTGGDSLTLGFTSYVSPVGGLVFWVGLEFPIYQNSNGAPHDLSRRINVGVTKQFVLHR